MHQKSTSAATRKREKTSKLSATQIEKLGQWMQQNRPLPSSKNAHFQNKAKCTTFVVKMSFILHENEKLFPYQRLSTLDPFDSNRKILFRLQNVHGHRFCSDCLQEIRHIFSKYWIRLSTI